MSNGMRGLATLCAAILVLTAPTVNAQSGSGIVRSVVKAPVAPNGDVAGAATDIVINLAVNMDPAARGKVLRKGETLRIKLPSGFSFANEKNYPIKDVFGAPDCKPGLLKCSTGVLLQGWPQNPILPSFPPGKTPQYSLSFDSSSNTLIFLAKKAIDGLPFPGPGIKQAHLILLGFSNPKQPGSYPIRVSIFDSAGKERESGVGNLNVRANPAPSINITSAFVPGDANGSKPPNPNTIYQKTKVGKPAPMPWDFLVWDTNGKPYVGVKIVQKGDAGGTLVHEGKIVGRFGISSPHGAKGQKVSGGPSIGLPATPVIGKSFGAPIPVGRLTVSFSAGSQPGRYYTTFELDGGSSATMVVDVSAGK